MHVLITNDDGVDSPGIHAPTKGMRHLGLDVTIAAPSWDSSGASALWAERTDLHWATAVDVARRIVSWIVGGADRPPGPLVLGDLVDPVADAGRGDADPARRSRG